MSSLKVDTIQNRSGGAVTLTKQEAFKHYVHYNHISDTVVKSFNLSSVNDDAAGEYTVTMQNAMSDINYVILASCNFEADGQSDARFNHSLNRDNSTGNEVAPTTTAYKVGTDDDSGNADLKYCYSAVVGDLA